MNRIEQFNHDINLSDHTRYEKWADYRKQMIKFIDHHLNLTQDKNLLIIGAGNCDDLDLAYFSSKFHHVILSDIDLTSIKLGIKKQQLDPEDFTLVKEDFSGFDKILFFENLLDDLFKMKTKEEINSYLIEKTKLGLAESTFDYLKGSYEFILISPIFTQLIYHQVLKTTEVLKEMDYDLSLISVIEESMLNLMPSIIDHFNNKVAHLLSDHAKLVVLSDIFQSHMNESFDTEVKQAIKSTNLMDLLYQKYVNTYGYGLGDYGLLSLEEILHMVEHHWFIWPFDDKINMTVQCVIFQNKKDGS